MRKFGLMAACLALAATACAPMVDAVTGGPVTVANKSALDEQVGLTLTLAYTATSRAVTLAINTGLVKDAATIARIGKLDSRAYAAVQAVRTAYLAANSASYLSALSQARQAVADLLAAARGPVSQLHLLPQQTPAAVAVVQGMTKGGVYLKLADYRLATKGVSL